jgi:hypothetical protein
MNQIGLFVSVIGFIFGCIFFVISGRQLKKESAKLRHLNELLLRGFHNAGVIDVIVNESGEPISLNVKLVGVAGGTVTATGDISVKVNRTVGGTVTPTGNRAFEVTKKNS